MSSKKSRGVWETVKTFVYAVLIALAVRTFLYEPFNIPSGSMIPSLLVGDYLFVSKFSYGYSRYSLPLGLPLVPGRIFAEQPRRGDVAVFKLPRDNRTDYIKRIIGLPGDRIQMRGGQLYLNGQPIERRRIDAYRDRERIGGRAMAQYIETLPGGPSYRIVESTDNSSLDDTGVYTVPPGHFFAMGDNRDNSLDSRTPNVGFVPAVNLIGRAEFLFFSTNGTGRLWEVWNWPRAIRFGRLFNAVE